MTKTCRHCLLKKGWFHDCPEKRAAKAEATDPMASFKRAGIVPPIQQDVGKSKLF